MIPEIKLTSAGAALLAKVPAGEPVPLSRWQFGTGALAPGESIDRTALIAPIDYLEITSLENKETRSTVLGQFTNQGREAFSWEELGLLATDPDGGEILFCYGNAFGSGEKIQAGTEQLREFIFGTVLVFDSAENVTAVVDHSLVFIPLREKGQPSGVATLGNDGKVPEDQLPEMDYIPTPEKGAAGGVATLGTDGKVPSGQLPDMDYDPAGSAAAVQNLLAGHTANLDNPHQVQASQIPCLPWENVAEAISDINNQLNKTAETQYKWAKSQYQLSQAGTSSAFTLAYDDRVTTSKTVYYSAEVSMTADHQAVLVNPITLNYTPGNIASYLSTLRGKYAAVSATGTPYYVSPTATIRESTASVGSRYYQYLEPSYKVSVVRQSLGYVYSEIRHTYPDAGERDGYYYEYAGEENTPVIPKIVTGTYTGTGAAQTILLGKRPKAVLLGGDGYDSAGVYYKATMVISNYSPLSTIAIVDTGFTVSGNTSATTAFSKSGVTYWYVALL